MNVHAAGAWQLVKNIYVHSGGIWRAVQQGWVHSGGVWRQFYSIGGAFTPVQHLFTVNVSNATETIPAGASNVVIECFGATGYGGHGDGSFKGGGGGSGGYSRSIYSVSLFNDGTKTFTYTVGLGGNTGSSVSSGTGPAISTMTGPVGGDGGIGSGSIGAGGTAGAIGTNGNQATSPGNAGTDGDGGGLGVTGIHANGAHAPGGVINPTTNAPGLDGVVSFYYT